MLTLKRESTRISDAAIRRALDAENAKLTRILNEADAPLMRALYGEDWEDEDGETEDGAHVGAGKSKKPKQERGAHLETENALKTLREIRLSAIKDNRQIPKKAAAMNEAGITDKTWKKYDQELWARWDDKSYNQEKQE